MFDKGQRSSPKHPGAATLPNAAVSVFSLGAPFSQARYTLTFYYVLAMVALVLFALSYA